MFERYFGLFLGIARDLGWPEVSGGCDASDASRNVVAFDLSICVIVVSLVYFLRVVTFVVV